MTPQVALWFIVLSATTAGGLLASIFVFSIVRYSRREAGGDADGPGSTRDISLMILTLIAIFGGMWIAGFFGTPPVIVLAGPQ